MKITLSLILTFFVFTWAGAQEDPAKDMKKVSRNLANYNLDPTANADALTESVSLIEGVVKNSAYAKDGKAWLLYGNVYAEITNSQTQALVFDSAGVIAPDAVVKTYKGYKNAVMYAEKSYDKKDAITGLKSVLPNMYYVANTILNRQDYVGAYPAYQAVAEAEKLVEENGEEGIFTTAAELQSTEFITGVCAFSAEKHEEAAAILADLKKNNYDDAGVYEYLFKTYEALGKKEEAQAVLAEGRTRYPDDKGLLFAEINVALGSGDLEALVDKLKLAMAAEPENISVPTTLGNVYDQLYQASLAAGDLTAAHSHFENAKIYIQKALDLNPNHFDAVYMMGALEYNKAAELAAEVNKLAEDYTKEGTKKYDAKQAEMMAQFDKAMPFFEKAEQLNPDDSNTLLALREIYARKGDFDKSNEYKAKFERINGN